MTQFKVTDEFTFISWNFVSVVNLHTHGIDYGIQNHLLHLQNKNIYFTYSKMFM